MLIVGIVDASSAIGLCALSYEHVSIETVIAFGSVRAILLGPGPTTSIANDFERDQVVRTPYSKRSGDCIFAKAGRADENAIEIWPLLRG